MTWTKALACAYSCGLLVACASEADSQKPFTPVGGGGFGVDADPSSGGDAGRGSSGDGGGDTPPRGDVASDSGASSYVGADAGEETHADAGHDAGSEPPSPSAGCLDGVTEYAQEGSFSYEATSSGSVKLWVPDVPAGCKVPVVHLANGTGASCATYGAILRHLASHGFLTTCYEDTNTGQGTQCVMALETAFAEYPELADDKIGSTGHSQGGGAAFMCISRAEEKWGTSKIYAGLAMEPASGYGDSPRDWADYYATIKSPMFMFNGSRDSLVSARWVGQAFDALADDTEAYWYEASGAAHIPVPTRWTQESAVAWFRWKLLGDKQACEYFKQLPDGEDWDLQEEQLPTDC